MDYQKEDLINLLTERDKEILGDIILSFRNNIDTEICIYILCNLSRMAYQNHFIFLLQENSESRKLIWRDICEMYNSQTTNPKTIREICDIYEVLKSEAHLNQNTKKVYVYLYILNFF